MELNPGAARNILRPTGKKWFKMFSMFFHFFAVSSVSFAAKIFGPKMFHFDWKQNFFVALAGFDQHNEVYFLLTSAVDRR